MKKVYSLILIFCVTCGVIIGSSFYYNLSARDGQLCGTCQPNPSFPGLTYCDYTIPGGGCGANVGATCILNCDDTPGED